MNTVLITGTSRGIGRALVDVFLEKGWHVLATTKDGETPCVHQNLTTYKLDLSSSQSIRSCAGSLAKHKGQIDILINNAGALFDEDETRLLVEKLRQTLEVNLIGTIDFTEHVITLLSSQAHIVNVSSSAGSLVDMDDDEHTSHFPYHYPAYKISKTALNMYTRTLGRRLNHEGTGIVVSSVHPGWVRTDMGGEEAPITPQEAATDIFKLATSRPPTGYFWFKGEKHPW